MKILVCDDHPIFREGLCEALAELDAEFVEASDSDAALRSVAADNAIELVLLDLVMPNMDGAETFHALRKIDPSVRVLISSGQTELAGARELLAAGVQGFLQKPYDAGTLGDAISRATFGPRKWR